MLLRTAINNDVSYEISEFFEISTGAVSGGVKNPTGVVGVVTIKDDGSSASVFENDNKTKDPTSGTADNDRRDVFVSGGTFNEGSKYAIFTAGNTPGRAVDLSVADDTASVLGGGGQQPEILYSIDGGLTWVEYTWNGATGNRPVAPVAFGGEFLVAVNITREADTPFEGNETFTLKAKDATDTDEATGKAIVVDDGTGKIVLLLEGKPVGAGNAVIEDTGTTKDDDRAVSVAGKPDVSEGSNAIFTVTLTGNPDGTDVSLALGKAGDTAAAGDYSALTGATAYYYDGSTKTLLTISEGKVTLPAGVTSFFVSVPTTQDGAYEGGESFTLEATAFGGAKSGSGSSSILDDGSGKVYDDRGVDSNGTPDDDRSISVTGSPDVSEGSNAIFAVTLSGNPTGTEVTLALGKGGDTAGSGDYSALTSATAYYYDGSTKTPLTISEGKVTLPAGVTSFFVSVPTTQDGAYEGGESFTLEATAFGGAKSGSGTSSILDDGSGQFYDDKGVVNPSGGTPDDDRVVSVAGEPDVSEGSNAIFTVTLSGNPGPGSTEVSLVLGKAGDTAGSGDYSALTGATAYYYDGSTKTPLTISEGKVLLPAGVTSFFVSVPTTPDGVYEGPETVTLQASAFGGKTGSGSSTILDDGSGKVYDDKGDPSNGTPDDDRNISVTGKPDVSEGANAIFTVTLTGNPTGTNVTLELGAGGDTAATTDYNPLANATAYYFNATVKTVLTITNGVISLPPGITSFFVSVRTTQDTPYEGSERFTLKATAFGDKTASDTSTILDDGTGKSYDDKGVPISGATPDDDRTLTVTAYGPVNEGSQYAMFTVSAIEGNSLDLNLQNATSGTPAIWAGFTSLEFSTNGTSWTTYSGANKPVVPAGGKVYVRVDITSEQDDSFEGSETFALKAAYTTNTARSAFADTSIIDDGTGKKYGPDVTEGLPQESTISLDADTGLSVNSITVNEGSSFAVFMVSGAANLQVSLELTNGTSTGLTGLAYSLNDGLNWTAYTSGTVPLPGSGKMLVRTSLTPEQEALFENSETFTLKATPSVGTAATGTATIRDDGTGIIFNDNGTPNNTAVKDDDRALAVNSITVNEGSPFAVFTLTANVGQTLSLGLSNGIQNTTARQGDGTPADGTEDYNPAVLEVWDPSSGPAGAWVAYSGAFTVPGTGVGPSAVLARVKLNPDPVFEGPEDFRLTASYTSGASRSATGVATIVDNGTGTKYPDAPPNAGPVPVTDTTDLDDDRILIAVSSVTVAESAGFAEVTVSLSKAASSPISFTPFLTARTASLPSDFGPALESSTDGGQSWQAVTGPLTFAVGQTSLRLRTTINDDSTFETSERFEVNTGAISSGLVANPSGAVGTVTITDDDVEILGSVAVQLRSTGNEAGVLPNVFRITRSGNFGAGLDLVVPFSLSSTSRFGIDYSDPTTSGVTFDATTSRGTVTIKAGESFVDLVIPTVDNALVDGTRALPFSIGAPTGYTVTTSSAQGSILDNDTAPPPEVSIGKGNVVEPDLGQTRLVNLSLQLSRAATQNTTITYDVIAASAADVQGRLGFDGQPLALATPGVDYTVISGSVTLAAGLTSTIIQVPVIGDNLDENDELFYARIVSVNGGNGATISTAANRGEIIIIDNENTSGLNIDYSTSSNAIEIRGGTANDVIIGSSLADTIYGNEGNDYLRGGLGADTLTGGVGADIFSYTSLADSTRASTDRLRDFAPGGGLSTGDRLQFTGQAAVDLRTATGSSSVDGLPSAIYNASLVTPLTDLSAAITAAFNDKDLSRTGNQALALGEAVIFTQGSGRLVNSYLIVNTGGSGYNASDFMMNITAWSSSGFGRGQLAVSDFFQSAFV